jgi:hypothetical protein
LRVEPCPSQPCKFNVGDKVDVILEFIANQNASDVKLYANLRTGGLFNYEISYKGIDQNACNNGSDSNKLSCPLVKGKSYKFIISQVVPYASRFNVKLESYGQKTRFNRFDILFDRSSDTPLGSWSVPMDAI